MLKQTTFQQNAKKLILLEASAVQALTEYLDDNFDRSCEHILACEGRLVVIGMGKSGHIGRKIAATFASTGTSSFFIHPAEASHGDIGMLKSHDVVLLISNSGETEEILFILPLLQERGIPVIALTSKAKSTLAVKADCFLNLGDSKEACFLGLAPTTSTTTTLVMGDALAMAVAEARGLKPEDFARNHPGGSLGKRLLLKTETLMHSGDAIPKVSHDTTLKNALVEMTNKRLGMTLVVNDSDELLGIFTDGDLRRTIANSMNLNDSMQNLMTVDCRTIHKSYLAYDALTLMRKNSITALVVTENSKPIGIIHMHDILKTGLN